MKTRKSKMGGTGLSALLKRCLCASMALVFTLGFVQLSAHAETQPISVIIEATATLTGKDLEDGEFSFNLDFDGQGISDNLTAENDAKGIVSFEEMLSEEGEYSFFLYEDTSDAAPGITYDNRVISGQVSVWLTDPDDPDSGLEYNVSYEVLNSDLSTSPVDPVFYNVFTPDTTGEVPPQDDGELVGATIYATVDYTDSFHSAVEMADDQFSFILSALDGINYPDEIADQLPIVAGNDSEGNIFIDLDIPSTENRSDYYFTLEEDTSSAESGVSIDSTVYKVHLYFDPSAEENSQIVTTFIRSQTPLYGSPVFHNVLSRELTELYVSAGKTLTLGENCTLPEGFSESYAATIEAITEDAPLPSLTRMTTADFTAAGSKDFVSIGPLTYSQAGTYEYLIKEDIPEEKTFGMKYDKSEYVLSILAESNGSNMVLTPSYTQIKNELGEETNVSVSKINFTNCYEAPSIAKITSSQLSITKTLQGTLPKARAFAYTLRLAEGDASKVSMPAELTTVTEEISSGSASPVGFGDIGFRAPGTFVFAIEERPVDDPKEDEVKEQDLTVKVKEADGALNAAIVKSATDDEPVSGAFTFQEIIPADSNTTENKPADTNTTENKPADSNTTETNPTDTAPASPVTTEEFFATKQISGDTPAENESFSFSMSAQSFTAPTGSAATMTASEMPMPTGSTSGAKTASVTGAGKASFGTVTYSVAGTYVYSISEQAGTNKQYSYDTAVYTVTDTVSENAGALAYTRAISKGTASADQCLFTNTYTLPTGELSISATASGNLASQTKEFTITVSLSADGAYSFTGSESGNISNGGQIKLSHGERVVITLPAGTTYKVSESDYTGYSLTSSGTSGTITANQRSTAEFKNYMGSTPKTGDDSALGSSFGAMLLSLAGMGALLAIKKSKKFQ